MSIGVLLHYIKSRRRQELRSIQLYQIQAEEKALQKIAEELHDNLSPTLLLTRIQLEQLIQIKEKSIIENCIKRLDGVIEETRQLGALSATSILGQKGLIEAIKDLLSTIEQYKKISTSLSTDQISFTLAPERERILFRIIQEAIQNILKHAQATEIDIQLREQKNGIGISIRDNGIGFEPNAVRSGLGLRNIQERTQALNGKLTLISEIGAGTLLHLLIPKL
jgi:signal transduction histidine kinase